MKQTIAEGLLRKFEKLADAVISSGMESPDWLNNAMEVLENHRSLDTWTQVKDAWNSRGGRGNDTWQEVMVQANALWTTARVHPMFK